MENKFVFLIKFKWRYFKSFILCVCIQGNFDLYQSTWIIEVKYNYIDSFKNKIIEKKYYQLHSYKIKQTRMIIGSATAYYF